ncbi:MAG: Asp-tRNA(Asn)/Glu-tRNA(Gln) amidotransferase subunit GatB [Deltaproteobacteria bacterium]|nr:Asp-tRNA(Asn)/Glu-tRNA(Gln) amidotransferase subunit GatB [Deltaproteobacteria bacterium]
MTTAYEAIIGLEVHAQLLTTSKLFCGCSTAFGAPPNSNICPVCTGQPGALPVLNQRAVEFAIRAGLALHCRIAPVSLFARKNYFYPDLPKGYQISQYDQPLCLGGHLDISCDGEAKRITILRIHMEEDAGKSTHDIGQATTSHVDLNRACVPLIEIVSGPDLRSPQEAGQYLRALRAILMYLHICDGNMEEGSLRCDANISIRPKGSTVFGTRTELKNLNSFRFLERALAYEIERQIDVVSAGGTVVQETLLWDEKRGRTLSMRSKEEAHDYRYFPDPDLPPLVVDDAMIGAIRAALPELPEAKMARYTGEFGLSAYDARVLTSEKALATFFEHAVTAHRAPKKIANWITTELLGRLNARGESFESLRITPPQLAGLVALVDEGTISGKMAKQVFDTMYATGEAPQAIIAREGLSQVSDSAALETMIDELLATQSAQVAAYRQGKTNLFGFFVGQIMKKTAGRANPALVNALLRKKLEEE